MLAALSSLALALFAGSKRSVSRLDQCERLPRRNTSKHADNSQRLGGGQLHPQRSPVCRRDEDGRRRPAERRDRRDQPGQHCDLHPHEWFHRLRLIHLHGDRPAGFADRHRHSLRDRKPALYEHRSRAFSCFRRRGRQPQAHCDGLGYRPRDFIHSCGLRLMERRR